MTIMIIIIMVMIQITIPINKATTKQTNSFSRGAQRERQQINRTTHNKQTTNNSPLFNGALKESKQTKTKN